jgi:hypothetical protein
MKDRDLQISCPLLFLTSNLTEILFKTYLTIFAFAYSIPEDIATSVECRQSLFKIKLVQHLSRNEWEISFAVYTFTPLTSFAFFHIPYWSCMLLKDTEANI